MNNGTEGMRTSTVVTMAAKMEIIVEVKRVKKRGEKRKESLLRVGTESRQRAFAGCVESLFFLTHLRVRIDHFITFNSSIDPCIPLL